MDEASQALINQCSAILSALRDARINCKKIGKKIYHMSEMLINYIHTSLSRIGIRKWAPYLDAQPDSLYNEACQISAIQGEHHKDKEKKVIQRAQGRLCDAHYKFAINNGFPKQYINIIKHIPSHRDNEYNASKNLYIFKKLPFRSDAANKFFRQLDDVICTSNKNDGVRDQSFRNLRIKNAPTTLFPKAPKGVPIDFYNPDWFNEKRSSQKIMNQTMRTIGNMAG
ncbi:hypothetical protein VP01_733g5 [Puccinia sorghi]|uniref:Uncharacterized protein n=1 Tax=Puccinia sorghi TaxID=27349 RepID=A0A0L6UF13_9BASI|nr:hypothetical protein VP01_733g5 [Puccinia sorghi]